MIGERNPIDLGVLEPGLEADLVEGQGDNWINWTWPACRPGKARSVDPGIVDNAIRPIDIVSICLCDRVNLYAPCSFSLVSHCPIFRKRNFPLSSTGLDGPASPGRVLRASVPYWNAMTRWDNAMHSVPYRHVIPLIRSLRVWNQHCPTLGLR